MVKPNKAKRRGVRRRLAHKRCTTSEAILKQFDEAIEKHVANCKTCQKRAANFISASLTSRW